MDNLGRFIFFIGAGGQLRLNENNAEGSDGGVLWIAEPTSSVFILETMVVQMVLQMHV